MTKAFLRAGLGLVPERRAVTAIEYALIASLVAVVIVIAVRGLGTNLAAIFNTASTEL